MRFFYNTKFPFMKYRKLFFLISGALVAFSIFSWMKFGLNYGIEFSGGTQLILRYKDPVTTDTLTDVREKLGKMNLGDIVVHEYGEADSKGRVYSILIRVESTSEAVSKKTLDVKTDVSEVISQELMSNSSKSEKNGGKEDLNAIGKVKLASYLAKYVQAPTQIPEYVDDYLTDEEIKTLSPSEKYYRFLGQLIANYRDNANVALIRNFDDLLNINKDADLIKLNDGKPVNFITKGIIENLKNEFFLNEFVVAGVDMVGPSVGSDLRAGAINALIFATIGILIYITIRFKFRFGVAAVVALLHDVIITVGFYALSGKAFTLSIVAALLTIVGYSLNDTIVVCDRIRENVNKYRTPGNSYEELVSLSINQTLSRTLLTSSTTLLVLVFLLFFGGEVLSGFSFAMLVGMIAGTYSSDCLVSPILVVWNNLQEKYRGKEKQKGSEYVKRSLKTLFPEKRETEKVKEEAVKHSHMETSDDNISAAASIAEDDFSKKKHMKRKKGITGRKKKRHR